MLQIIVKNMDAEMGKLFPEMWLECFPGMAVVTHKNAVCRQPRPGGWHRERWRGTQTGFGGGK